MPRSSTRCLFLVLSCTTLSVLWTARGYAVQVETRVENVHLPVRTTRVGGPLPEEQQHQQQQGVDTSNATGSAAGGGTTKTTTNGAAPSANSNASNKKKDEPKKENTFWAELHEERLVLFLGLPVAVALAILFERAHHSWLRVDFGIALDRPHLSVDNSLRGLTTDLFSTAVSLGSIYFKHAGRIKGLAYIAMLMSHNWFGKWIDVQFFSFTARFWDFYQNPKLEVFEALILNWLVLHTGRVLTSVYSFYIEKMLKLHWREHLTLYFEKLWVPRNYEFALREDRDLDNPDQRIQDDIGDYVESSYGLTIGVFDALSNVVLYSYMLFTVAPTSFFGLFYLPGWPIYFALLYAALGSLCIQSVGRELTVTDWQIQRYNGNFRAELRWNLSMADRLAAMHAGRAQLRRLYTRFEELKVLAWGKIRLERQLDIFLHMFGSIEAIMFTCMLLPYFIKGEVTLGNIKQCEFALHRVRECFDFFVGRYQDLSRYRACCDRLSYFRRKLLEEHEVVEMKSLTEQAYTPSTGIGGSGELRKRKNTTNLWSDPRAQMIDETETSFCSSSSNNANNGMNKGRTTLNFIKDPLLTSTSAATVVCMDAYKNMGLENDDNNGDKMKALTEGDPYSIDPALYEAARRRELILRRVRCLEQGAAVTVLLPSGQTIAENVQLNNFLGEATRGQRILLCGPEGTGKSTLLRTLAGVWPFVRVDACGGGASPTRKHQGNPVDVDFGTLSTRPGGYGGSFELENKPSLSLKPKKEPARILDFVFRYSATEGLKLFPKSLAEAESEDEDDKHDLDTPTKGCRSTTSNSKLNTASRRRDLQNEHQRLPYLIPQRGPGLPYPMTFREAICFPDSSSAYSDREIYTALKKVRLSLEGKRKAKEASSSTSSSTYGGNSGGGAGGSSNGTNASRGVAMNSEAELRDYVDDDEEFLVGGASNSGAGGYNYDDSFSGGAARSPTDFMDEQEKSIGLDTAVDVAQVLSGGELQRLMVAHCLLAKPRVLLLDEALVHLSDENQRWIYELLNQELVQHPTARTTLITVSHEWRKLISCHDAFFTIKEKKIVTFDAVAEAKEIAGSAGVVGMGSHATVNSGAISTLGMGSMNNLINRAGSFL